MREKPPNMPITESTPLLVVQVASRRPRYRHSTLRGACSLGLATLLSIAVVLFLVPFAVLPRDHGSICSYLPWSNPFPHTSWPHGNGLNYTALQNILQTLPSAEKAKEWSKYYTSGSHLAGKNLSQAIWTQERWQEYGLETSISSYDVYINYPADHRLALLEKKGGNTVVKFEATLEEDVLPEDSTSGLVDRIPTFHGYSSSGNVTAQFVYANFGTYQDFEDLIKANVSLEGKIALVKYGAIFRGLKVKRAQELGMVGVVIYSDPQEDGDITEANGYEAYPDGPARNPSAVQRGSVQFLSIAPGDPTTPGYPSTPGCPRKDPRHSIPSIPSLPISYKEAIPLLKALNGHGPKASDFDAHWQGGGLSHKGVEYNIGPTPEDVVLNLYNEQEYITTPIWNVIGVIKGTIPDEVVILGNHRDAWVAGGAGDPNSGSAALNEVIRSFAHAMKAGWKPLRTIVFASWDGEEYGLIGSTEWVEENLTWLSKSIVAYLNVDVATSGQHFKASASPLLNKAIYEATSLVLSPNQTVEGQTVLDVWNGKISSMGSGSDFTAFQDFAGIPCVDYGFKRKDGDAVYQYHSNYDSFDWMNHYGDPNWTYHIAAAKVWSLTAAYLAEKPVLGLNATDYASGLAMYLDTVKEKATTGFSFKSLDAAIVNLYNAAVAFDAYTSSLTKQLDEDLPWWQWWKKVQLFFKIRAANDKYKYLERKMLHQQGLDGRNWFKHVVFAPGLWTGYSGAPFPGLVESFESGNLDNAKRWRAIIQEKIDDATALLK
ncbi:glutamate carboxypeptidase II [Blastomyces dermatitidis ER-3]|uniref:Glutamate carboxypeptidase II n=2 Tax=Ajellomyces dermatitidis TaxID=5039 RepID=F2T732_AJEDA|nr:glutamate carboxypeptidase II [Blastomyces dermatitidis ER-3]EEQ86559.1 glutamate carboxypeptidase II [Blastomyces dermatitidis ER-3]EGE79045.1 glutamate carboxypeptidase II [Blastomyces dermatitidis ATCC 18188]